MGEEAGVKHAVNLFSQLQDALSELHKDATPAFRAYVKARLQEVAAKQQPEEEIDAKSDPGQPAAPSSSKGTFKDTRPLLEEIPEMIGLPAESPDDAALQNILAEQRRLRAKKRSGGEDGADQPEHEAAKVPKKRGRPPKKAQEGNDKKGDNTGAGEIKLDMEEELDIEDQKMKEERQLEEVSGDEAKGGKGRGKGNRRKRKKEEDSGADFQPKGKAKKAAKDREAEAKEKKNEEEKAKEEEQAKAEEARGMSVTGRARRHAWTLLYCRN